MRGWYVVCLAGSKNFEAESKGFLLHVHADRGRASDWILSVAGNKTRDGHWQLVIAPRGREETVIDIE